MARMSRENWRERQAAGIDARRRRQRSRPVELDRLKREGVVAAALVPVAEHHARVMEELIDQCGGPDEVTPARRILIEDTCKLGIALDAELGRFVQTEDPAALERVATLANSRRSNLMAAGLDRYVREAETLQAYLEREARDVGADGTNGEESGSRGTN